VFEGSEHAERQGVSAERPGLGLASCRRPWARAAERPARPWRCMRRTGAWRAHGPSRSPLWCGGAGRRLFARHAHGAPRPPRRL